jgi:hypothetical protein
LRAFRHSPTEPQVRFGGNPDSHAFTPVGVMDDTDCVIVMRVNLCCLLCG